MARLLPNCRSRGTSGFQQVVRAFLSGTGLPFAEVLSAERIERSEEKVSGLNGTVENNIVFLRAFFQ
jgi:hypothetical protein